jgi:hypothetical protein
VEMNFSASALEIATFFAEAGLRFLFRGASSSEVYSVASSSEEAGSDEGGEDTTEASSSSISDSASDSPMSGATYMLWALVAEVGVADAVLTLFDERTGVEVVEGAARLAGVVVLEDGFTTDRRPLGRAIARSLAIQIVSVSIYFVFGLIDVD